MMLCGCFAQKKEERVRETLEQTALSAPVLPGIYNFQTLLSTIDSQRVGVVANHTSVIEGVHLIDTLLASGVAVKKVFAPEHGFRGDFPDGDEIKDSRDARTGLPIKSLYGNNKKPTKDDLKNIDLIVFDIQDVGARFYTYISTLHYVMEAAAENDIRVVILDRPNPNGHYLDGPILEPEYRSFVGLHPVPVVYGMTIGEYGKMINGESWLAGEVKCDLTVIPCKNYRHDSPYNLPVPPSPNLPNMASIYWYPSLCFFEGTNVSVGRGTEEPFTRIGEPGNLKGKFFFTPKPVPGASLNPKHKGEVCRGYNLIDSLNFNALPQHLDLTWLFRMYDESPDPSNFFRKDGYFELLAGTRKIREALENGTPINELRDSWKEELDQFQKVRAKYLIYP
jgi:uncharacterized protein YbbC (DUF1343 family)